MITRTFYTISDERHDGSYQICPVQISHVDHDDLMVTTLSGGSSSRRKVDELYDTPEDAKFGLSRRLKTEIATLHSKLAWKEKCLGQLDSEEAARRADAEAGATGA